MTHQICHNCGATCDPSYMICPSCHSYSLDSDIHTDDPNFEQGYIDGMELAQRCEHDGCRKRAIACYIDDVAPIAWFCETHAVENGFCRGCGAFWAGIDSFDFTHPGWCDHCWDEVNEDYEDYDESFSEYDD